MVTPVTAMMMGSRHKADATGIGINRTNTSSNAVDQYLATARDKVGTRSTVPEDLANRSGHSIPSRYATPAYDLAWYRELTCPSDVKKPRCTNVYTGTPSAAILR